MKAYLIPALLLFVACTKTSERQSNTVQTCPSANSSPSVAMDYGIITLPNKLNASFNVKIFANVNWKLNCENNDWLDYDKKSGTECDVVSFKVVGLSNAQNFLRKTIVTLSAAGNSSLQTKLIVQQSDSTNVSFGK